MYTMQKKFNLKYALLFFVSLLVRLLPFRAPNIEPIMATVMPFAKNGGALSGFMFGAGSVVAYDMITGTVGMWTLVDAFAYGLVGMGASWFLRNRENTRSNYLVYAILGTLVYDAITGFTVGPLFFGQSLAAAALGQIPFTALHLLGNGIFAVTISPVLYKWLSEEKVVAEAHSTNSLMANG